MIDGMSFRFLEKKGERRRKVGGKEIKRVKEKREHIKVDRTAKRLV